jgi:glycosidase
LSASVRTNPAIKRPLSGIISLLAAASFLLASCAHAPLPAPSRTDGPDISHVTMSDPGSPLPEGWQHGAFMEIFVRAWRDSDGDGHGDLRGLTQSLDYLQDLGIKGIWLMPITRNADKDHGYAVTDFRDIDPAYGTLADFDELIREAHKRGIGVIMDYVINHSAAENPLFANAAASRDSRFRDWYLWRDTAPTGWDIWGKNPWHSSPTGIFFGTFGAHMPDFNLENSEAMDYHRDSLRFWLNRGLDGFRLDAVPHLVEANAKDWNDQPESYALMGHIKALMDGYQRRYSVCEATASPQRWAKPYICGSSFAFKLESAIINAARGESPAIAEVAAYFRSAPLGMATFISNHDQFAGARLWDQLQGNEAQYRMVAATYLLLPGTPFIYFGEEIGMAGGAGLTADAALRSPMSWQADTSTGGFTHGTPFRAPSANVMTHNAAAERSDSRSLHAFYKSVIALRNRLPSIARGSYEHADADASSLSFQRRLNQERTVVVLNYGTEAINRRLSNLPPGARLAAANPAEPNDLSVDAAGLVQVALPPQSFRVYRVR